MATTVSQPGYFNLQEFTSAGALAVGGRLYFYAQGTTTKKNVYTEATGTTLHTLTSDGIGGEYLALDARGEAPAPVYMTSGAYDVCLKTSAGATVWTRRADPSSAETAMFTQSGTGATVRTVQSKMRDTVSITDFGASTSETAANNTTAINAAIAAATHVYIPPGTYSCNSLTLLTGVSISGAGASSVLSFPAGQTGIYGLSTGASAYLENVTLSNFKLLGAVAASGFSEFIHLLNVNGVRNFVVDNVQFVGFQGDGAYFGANTDNTRHNYNIKITNCLFDGVNKDNRNGLSVIDGDGVIVRGCTFQNCTKAGMPGFIDFEPNNIANVIRKVTVANCHFENTSSTQGAINVVIAYDLTTEPEYFTISGNTFDVTTHFITLLFYYAHTLKTNLVIQGNSGTAASLGKLYNHFDGVSIIGNTITQTSEMLLGFANTDTINNVIVSGNVFIASGAPNRAFSLRCGSGHIVSGNVFRDFAVYGFLTGIAGGTLSDTTIMGNTFVNCGTYSVGAVSGSVDGVSCTYLGNTYSSKHQFPAWRNDDTGDITNGDTSPTTFNGDTLPDSFTREGVFRAAINGDTAVPSTGGYQGLLECHCEAGENGRKWKYQVYFPANNTIAVASFYTRKAESGSDAWTAWVIHTGV